MDGLLELGIALRPSDIDIVYVTGYGFPARHGGPMYYADRIGLPLQVRHTGGGGLDRALAALVAGS